MGADTDTALTGFKDLPNTSYQYGCRHGSSRRQPVHRLSPPIEWDGEGNLVLEFALEDVTSQTDGNKTAG